MIRPVRWVADKLRVSSGEDFAGEITGWSIDSRTTQRGDLFIALRGPNHDGNVHVGAAFERGAVAAVVDRRVTAERRVFRVEDSLKALQVLAQEARTEWAGDVIGVTGSAGKTTSKDIIASVMAVEFGITKTEGNLNNHIGLPLSLLRMDERARKAVLELGMNHAGEIAELAQIARPNVGVVTNVGWAHIENFESIEGIAAAKRELIEALGASGTAVLNADDGRVAGFASAHAGRSVLYGLSDEATVRGEDVEYLLDRVRFRVGSARFESQLTGRHNVSNLLAGIAVAGVYGIAPERLVDAVRAIDPPKMRGQRIEQNGILIYNDCYNSNPDAVRAMLDVLRDTPAKRRIAVLGEMLELGQWAELLHRGIGSYAATCGVDVLIGISGAAAPMLEAAQNSGLSAEACLFFEDSAQAALAIRSMAKRGDVILFKGSRGVHVEAALQPLLDATVEPLAVKPLMDASAVSAEAHGSAK